MDKKAVLGFILIGVVLITWLYWSSSIQQQKIEEIRQTQDTAVTVVPEERTQPDTQQVITQKVDTLEAELKKDTLIRSYGNVFYNHAIGYTSDTVQLQQEKVITLENEKVKMEFTNYGGSLKSFIIKDYTTWEGNPLQLVDWGKGRELHLVFTSRDGKQINTRNLVFESAYENNSEINLLNDSAYQLIYTLNITPDESQQIKKIYTFTTDKHDFDVTYELKDPEEFISDNKYQVEWSSSLNLTEYRSDQEAVYSEAFAYMGGELETLEATSFNEQYKADFNGYTDYIASRNKYFGVYIIPLDRKGDGVYIEGYREPLKDEGIKEHYSISMKMDIKDGNFEKASFKILIVPLDYTIIKSYELELEKTLRFSLDFMVRPIAQYFILPLFLFLHSFIPNWGVVIIVFSIIMKILLNPLTKKQMQSMKKMSALSPKMTAIREKYKDDPVKANQQIMKMYKEEKINPAGGCLPLLLQLPILYALFGVFNSTIELRHSEFIFWIKDLSAPDVLFQLPFKIPIFGIDQVSGLATLMGITMFIQQKMTIKDPKQKAMIYIMPVMLTLLFFSFPAGLNLYYFMFNLLSILQQYYMNKKGEGKTEVVTTKVPSSSLAVKKPTGKNKR
jgi:YidC/Oxa1 family membrane protein insertase